MLADQTSSEKIGESEGSKTRAKTISEMRGSVEEFKEEETSLMGHIGERKVTNVDERQEKEPLSSNDLLSELLSEKV